MTVFCRLRSYSIWNMIRMNVALSHSLTIVTWIMMAIYQHVNGADASKKLIVLVQPFEDELNTIYLPKVSYCWNYLWLIEYEDKSICSQRKSKLGKNTLIWLSSCVRKISFDEMSIQWRANGINNMQWAKAYIEFNSLTKLSMHFESLSWFFGGLELLGKVIPSVSHIYWTQKKTSFLKQRCGIHGQFPFFPFRCICTRLRHSR